MIDSPILNLDLPEEGDRPGCSSFETDLLILST
jgi:hypothetical protein